MTATERAAIAKDRRRTLARIVAAKYQDTPNEASAHGADWDAVPVTWSSEALLSLADTTAAAIERVLELTR